MDFSSLHYEEFFDNGERINREQGLVPGFLLGAGVIGSEHNLYLNISVSGGTVDYEGLTTAHAKRNTRTDERFLEAELIAERCLISCGGGSALYTGLAYHDWRRNIRSVAEVSGLLEKYDWKTIFLGARLTKPLGKRIRQSIDLRLVQIFDPEIEVLFRDRPGTADFELGNRRGFRLSFPWTYQAQGHREIQLIPYYEEYRFGESGRVESRRTDGSVTTIYEPRSKTRKAGLTLLFRFK